MLIYLDTCCLQRPLDDRSQPRINLESEAILTILGLIEKQYYFLVSSEILRYEILQIPNEERKNNVLEVLDISKKFIVLNDAIEQQAEKYINIGIKPMDALHLASAVEGKTHYFCTVDDSFLKKAKDAETSETVVMSPLELIMEFTQ